MKENIPLIRPVHFSHKEFNEIVRRSAELIWRGYFTGINFLQSEVMLPETAIIIHCQHDSRQYLEQIKSCINTNYFIVPRLTYYVLRPEYFKKAEFKGEYRSAVFLDSDLHNISMDEAIKAKKKVTVFNSELDLIIPLDDAKKLPKLIGYITTANTACMAPWIDPVVIVKTEVPIEPLESFVNKYFVSMRRGREKFYSVLQDKKRVKALEIYLNNLCERTRIGQLTRSDFVFCLSQVNTEFAEYLTRACNPLRILE